MSHQSQLNVFLSKYKTIKGSAHTHTSMGDPKGSFYIPANEEHTFYTLYSKAIGDGADLYLTEKHRDISPVLIDFDFRFNMVNLQRRYLLEDIKKVVDIYMKECVKYVDIGVNDSCKVDVYVQEKSKPVRVNDNLVKDGFHIVIPGIVTKPLIQLMIRKDTLELIDKELKTKIGYDNEINDVFDEAVIDRNNWQMYGSKKLNCEAYKVTHIFEYDIDTNECKEKENRVSLSDLIDELSIRNKYFDNGIKDEKKKEVELEEKKIEEEFQKKRSENILMHHKNPMRNKYDKDLNIVKEIINILDVKRSDSYYDWIRVGWCLRNIDFSLLEDWVMFSSKSSKYKDGECEKMWNYMSSGNLGIGTLYMWAKQDNPIEYANIRSKDISTLVYNTLYDCTDYDISLVIFEMFRQEFRCSSITHSSWYEFKNHRWAESEKAHSLRNKMSTEVFEEYMRNRKKYGNRANVADHPDEEEKAKNLRDKCQVIATKMKNTSYKEKMIKEVTDKFRHISDKFEDKLDSDPYLLGFNNGVYDLDNLEFREGRPEDYISFSTNIDYVDYDVEHEHHDNIMRFISSVLPEEEVREYVLTLLASFLDGSNRDEKFHIWTGTGSNGKSKIIELLQQTIGDYHCMFNVSLLTAKRVGSNQTNSELVAAKGKRVAVLQEPDENERLNVGFMKEMTGGDTIICRGLFKEPIEFKPMFKMILTCNHMPSLPANDGGTWRRVRRVKFTSKFVDNPDPKKPNEYKIDKNLSSKFKNWRECFMGILLEYYKIYKLHGIKEPTAVTEATNEYQRKQDMMLEFVESYVSMKNNSKMYLMELMEAYTAWCKIENIKPTGKKEFHENLEQHLGVKATGRGNSKVYWNGYVMKNPDDDFDEDDNNDKDSCNKNTEEY